MRVLDQWVTTKVVGETPAQNQDHPPDLGGLGTTARHQGQGTQEGIIAMIQTLGYKETNQLKPSPFHPLR